MKARPCKLARTADLIPPDGAEIDPATVTMLAESIRDHGLREPIVVVGRHILHGVHRWAAVKQLGLATVEVVADDQAVSVIAENLHRRHFRDGELNSLRNRLVELKTAQIAQETQSVPEYTRVSFGKPDVGVKGGSPARGNPPIRKPTPKGEAVRQVAKQTGSTPRAVAASVKRAESVAEKHVAEAIKSGRIDNFDEYQMPIPAHIIGKYEGLRKIHGEIDNLMRKAQTLCKQVVDYGGEQLSYGQKWHELLHTVGSEARAYRPYALCPKCGGKGCNICRNVGLICEGMIERAKFAKRFGGNG